MTLFFVIVHYYMDRDVLAKMRMTRMDGWLDAKSPYTKVLSYWIVFVVILLYVQSRSTAICASL